MSNQEIITQLRRLYNQTADGEKVLHYLHVIEENTRRMALALENLVTSIKDLPPE